MFLKLITVLLVALGFNVVEGNNVVSAEESQIEPLILDVIHEYELPEEQVAVAYFNFKTGETYYLNPHQTMDGASTTKVGISEIYLDMIDEGYFTLDTHLPYIESYYEEGGGAVTNSPWQASYPIKTLIYEAIIHSDNTALNMLVNYYYANFGDPYHKLIEMSGIEVYDNNLYGLNKVNALLLNQLLYRLTTSERYEPLIEIMKNTQPNAYFKYGMDEDEQYQMAVKYGKFDGSIHDTGIYFDENDEPLYSLVVLTNKLHLDGMEIDQEFFGKINKVVLDYSKK